MRLWSIHPQLLDRAALVAGWREGLLAQAVLRGGTKGYTAHPQLVRFRALPDPMSGIGTWLHGLADEAGERGYRFDRALVLTERDEALRVPLRRGQLVFEMAHLRAKSRERSADWAQRLRGVQPWPHPLFEVIPGGLEAWEQIDG